MRNALIDLELRFLIAKYGRAVVAERLALLGEADLAELESQVAQHEASRQRAKPKKTPTAAQLASELVLSDSTQAEALRTLAQRFDDGTFLGTLREASAFLAPDKSKPRNVRSRKELAPALVKHLASMPTRALVETITDLDLGAGKSEYHRLAHRIMGKSDK